MSAAHHRGEAVTVLVVILAVALIGALGFIAWQNFGDNDDASIDSGVTDSSVRDKDREKSFEQKDSSHDLVIQEWAVKIPTETELPFRYHRENHQPYLPEIEMARIVMTDLTHATACGNEDGASNTALLIGQILRTENPDSPYGGTTIGEYFGKDLTVQVGNAYYFLQPSEGTGRCQLSDEHETAFRTASEQLRSSFKRLTRV